MRFMQGLGRIQAFAGGDQVRRATGARTVVKPPGHIPPHANQQNTCAKQLHRILVVGILHQLLQPELLGDGVVQGTLVGARSRAPALIVLGRLFRRLGLRQGQTTGSEGIDVRGNAFMHCR